MWQLSARQDWLKKKWNCTEISLCIVFSLWINMSVVLAISNHRSNTQNTLLDAVGWILACWPFLATNRAGLYFTITLLLFPKQTCSLFALTLDTRLHRGKRCPNQGMPRETLLCTKYPGCLLNKSSQKKIDAQNQLHFNEMG